MVWVTLSWFNILGVAPFWQNCCHHCPICLSPEVTKTAGCVHDKPYCWLASSCYSLKEGQWGNGNIASFQWCWISVTHILKLTGLILPDWTFKVFSHASNLHLHHFSVDYIQCPWMVLAGGWNCWPTGMALCTSTGNLILDLKLLSGRFLWMEHSVVKPKGELTLCTSTVNTDRCSWETFILNQTTYIKHETPFWLSIWKPLFTWVPEDPAFAVHGL